MSFCAHFSQLWAACGLSLSFYKKKWSKSYLTYSNSGFLKANTDSEMPFGVGGLYTASLKPAWWPLEIPMAFVAVEVFHCGKLFSVKVDKPPQGEGFPLIYGGNLLVSAGQCSGPLLWLLMVSRTSLREDVFKANVWSKHRACGGIWHL